MSICCSIKNSVLSVNKQGKQCKNFLRLFYHFLELTIFMNINTITISAGDYTIGNESFALSRPLHILPIKSFAIMQGTVTNQQFANFVSAGGYRIEDYWSEMGLRWRKSKASIIPAFWDDANFNAPEQPVVGISWYEALAFANWLSIETGDVWRLPSEVEWEAAASFDGTGTIHTAASGLRKTIPAIGTGYQSSHGVWNLRGNVWEWCSTRWGRNWQSLDYSYPYDASDGREDLSGSYARVMRGGSWFDPLQEAHPAKRARYLPGSRGSNIGFRLIRSII